MPENLIQVNVRLPEELKKRAEHMAVDFNLTLSGLLREAVELRVAELEAKALERVPEEKPQ